MFYSVVYFVHAGLKDPGLHDAFISVLPLLIAPHLGQMMLYSPFTLARPWPQTQRTNFHPSVMRYDLLVIVTASVPAPTFVNSARNIPDALFTAMLPTRVMPAAVVTVAAKAARQAMLKSK